MIIVKGARQHNLKGINLELPDEKLIIITGVSGSGKSSLAFDTIYAEGQRRYIESFSSYSRQFLEQMEKPQVDSIEGLSPSISIDQKTGNFNPRSTVGTVTECYDYLRLLFARTGTPHCPHCRIPIEARTIDNIINLILSLPEGTKFQLLAPVVRAKKGHHRELLDDLRSEGFSKVRIDGKIIDLSSEINLARYHLHNIEVVIDRLKIKSDMGERFTESINLALRKGGGTIIVDISNDKEILLSQHMSCPECNFSIDELAPRIFSFNSPYGSCPDCSGIGIKKKIDLSLLIKDINLNIAHGAIPILNISRPLFHSLLKKTESFLKLMGLNIDMPLYKIDSNVRDILFYGSSDREIDMSYDLGKGKGVIQFKSGFEGLINYLEEIYGDKGYEKFHKYIEPFLSDTPCDTCFGMRLKKESLSVKIAGKSIGELSSMSLKELKSFLSELRFFSEKEPVGKAIIKEIVLRLDLLVNLGVGYLSLHRRISTLSGGELQRIRLGTQIGSGLVGVLYILDEPTIGLHQRDNEKLIRTLEELRDMGNTVIVVEHDEQVIKSGDFIVDIGPGSGNSGGYLVASGSLKDIMNNENSLTGSYLSQKKYINSYERKTPDNNRFLMIKGARKHNLKNIDVSFPLGLLNCVTGVSGSGKSTLVNDVLYKAVTNIINNSNCKQGFYDNIAGIEYIDKVIMIDQTPIGRTPRSNPVTYTGVFTHIREVFSLTPKARLRGYGKGHFSFNVKGGRCERCLGSGKVHIEMNFLPDLYITCEECKGKRYNSDTLEIEFNGKNISQILEMTVKEGREFFSDFSKITGYLDTLEKVGLGYLQLGQSSTLLSGGEAQRVKLSAELARRSTGKTLYILDEPTTGLHFQDVTHLLKVLLELRNMGNTIIIIEHNMDVIKAADYIIDLGPEGGEEGGYIVASGSPEEITLKPEFYTGKFLKKALAI